MPLSPPSFDPLAALADLLDPPGRGETIFPAPGALAAAVDPRIVQTPALSLIDAELVRLAEQPDQRLIITMPPQEGKSLRVARDFIVWWLHRDADARIVVASYAQGLANRNGKAIRRLITSNPQLGLRIAADNGAAADWGIAGRHGGVYSVGIGGGLTGRPADVMVIDDPIKDRKEADSETFRQNVWDWWTDVASARLAPGAPVVVILTRWHEDDLAGRLLADAPDQWRLLNIPAQADHHPEAGEIDPLGRQPGEFMASARGRTHEQWEARKRAAGPRTWASLYQGRPSPDTGDVFQRGWWRYYETPRWWQEPDGSYRVDTSAHLIQSWDMAFKDTKGSDYVVGSVWMRDRGRAVLLDQVRARLTFSATVAALRRLSEKWPQAHGKLVEDKANGTAVIDTLKDQIPGIIPVTPHESKYARAAAVSPFVEAGNVWLPDPSIALFDVAGYVEELAAFPAGAHDDQVDATSQALHRLLVSGGPVWLLDETPAGTALDGSPLLREIGSGLAMPNEPPPMYV